MRRAVRAQIQPHAFYIDLASVRLAPFDKFRINGGRALLSPKVGHDSFVVFLPFFRRILPV
jgi:hypothetical protein